MAWRAAVLGAGSSPRWGTCALRLCRRSSSCVCVPFQAVSEAQRFPGKAMAANARTAEGSSPLYANPVARVPSGGDSTLSPVWQAALNGAQEVLQNDRPATAPVKARTAKRSGKLPSRGSARSGTAAEATNPVTHDVAPKKRNKRVRPDGGPRKISLCGFDLPEAEGLCGAANAVGRVKVDTEGEMLDPIASHVVMPPDQSAPLPFRAYMAAAVSASVRLPACPVSFRGPLHHRRTLPPSLSADSGCSTRRGSIEAWRRAAG